MVHYFQSLRALMSLPMVTQLDGTLFSESLRSDASPDGMLFGLESLGFGAESSMEM